MHFCSTLFYSTILRSWGGGTWFVTPQMIKFNGYLMNKTVNLLKYCGDQLARFPTLF